MIINKLTALVSGDDSRYAWQGLKRFHNIEYTKAEILSSQDVPAKYEKFVKKQCEQIRYCLVQAEEYSKAAKVVSYATNPLLYYYSIMSLALAEILYKQDGNSSLDKARATHGHHGLELKGAELTTPGADLSVAATQLRATPHSRSNQRMGTFELWHRSAREGAISGKSITIADGSKQEGQSILGIARDARMPQIPDSGISLLDCYRRIPRMAPFMASHDIQSGLCRARMELNRDITRDTVSFSVFIHPQSREVIDSVVDHITFSSRAFESLHINYVNPGYIFQLTDSLQVPFSHFSLPNAIQEKIDTVWMCDNNQSLNEFGLYYVAFYILGNYARYYPDKWMQEIEKSTPLALSVMELVSAAEDRMPMLLLGELTRSMFIKL